MLELLRYPVKVSVSNNAFANLKRWAILTGQSLEDALEGIVQQYLEHYEFYQQPRSFQSFFTQRKIRIFRVLRVAPANISAVARKTRIRYDTVKKILESFELNGIATEKKYGHIRIFKLNQQNPLTQRILATMDAWYKPTEIGL